MANLIHSLEEYKVDASEADNGSFVNAERLLDLYLSQLCSVVSSLNPLSFPYDVTYADTSVAATDSTRLDRAAQCLTSAERLSNRLDSEESAISSVECLDVCQAGHVSQMFQQIACRLQGEFTVQCARFALNIKQKAPTQFDTSSALVREQHRPLRSFVHSWLNDVAMLDCDKIVQNAADRQGSEISDRIKLTSFNLLQAVRQSECVLVYGAKGVGKFSTVRSELVQFFADISEKKVEVASSFNVSAFHVDFDQLLESHTSGLHDKTPQQMLSLTEIMNSIEIQTMERDKCDANIADHAVRHRQYRRPLFVLFTHVESLFKSSPFSDAQIQLAGQLLVTLDNSLGNTSGRRRLLMVLSDAPWLLHPTILNALYRKIHCACVPVVSLAQHIADTFNAIAHSFTIQKDFLLSGLNQVINKVRADDSLTQSVVDGYCLAIVRSTNDSYPGDAAESILTPRTLIALVKFLVEQLSERAYERLGFLMQQHGLSPEDFERYKQTKSTRITDVSSNNGAKLSGRVADAKQNKNWTQMRMRLSVITEFNARRPATVAALFAATTAKARAKKQADLFESICQRIWHEKELYEFVRNQSQQFLQENMCDLAETARMQLFCFNESKAKYSDQYS